MVSKKYQNSKCEREFLNFFHARAGGNLPKKTGKSYRVRPAGIEPATISLKGCCSTD